MQEFDKAVEARVMAAGDKLAAGHEDKVHLGRDGWKARYYASKLPETTPAEVAAHYVRGLVWVLRYYYHGCCSWDWYFPFHYAPFPSDIAACLAQTRVRHCDNPLC
jgi:5'-3' exonuclease